LIEKEIEKREKLLFDTAVAVEQNEALKRDMPDWDVTKDGLDDESW